MSNRRVVLLGLLAGMTTAVVAGALVVALSPDVVQAPSPAAPSPALPSSAPGPSGPVPSGPGGSVGPTAGSTAAPSDSPASGAFRVGQPAPALRLPQLGGGTVDLAALRGHPVWIEFMATWCPSCRDEFPAMNGFAARYEADGLVVVAVDVREDDATVAAFANELATNFPVALDATGSTAATWGAAGLPMHFFVDAAGIVRDGAIGGIGPDVMAAGLRTIMPGVSVTP